MRSDPDSILVVVAHPDDEVLGFGGSAWSLSRKGYRVTAAILCGDVDARARRPQDAALRSDVYAAADVLGMGTPILGGFPNIRMNAVPHLEMVQFIEQAMRETSAAHLFTHHPGDLNDDHRQVARAAQAAARLSQRVANHSTLLSLNTMEVPSSTDWSFDAMGRQFQPTSFVEIGGEGVAAKLQALKQYRGVMRDYPHPRSDEVIRSLAALRGATAGLEYAEAFEPLHVNLGALL